MKLNLFKNRGARNRTFTAITVAAIAVLLILNLIITQVGQKNTFIVDLTDEELYTLSDLMKQENAYVEDLENEVTVTFCADPDTLLSYEITRVAYFMALQMQKQFDNFKVKTVNVTYNPTAASRYKATSMSQILPTDIIVSYGNRYRVVSANYFWITQSTGELVAYNGEYKLSNLIKSVTTVNRPKAYFVVGHGESYYDSNNPDDPTSASAVELSNLLSDRGLESLPLDLSKVDKVPDDCMLLIINNPTSDYDADGKGLGEFGYSSECEKIDRYIIERQGSVMVSKDYSITLPNLEDFLYEWGFDFGQSLIVDEESFVENSAGTHVNLITEYDYNSEEETYGSAIYEDFVLNPSSPRFIVANTGYITCSFHSENELMPEAGSGEVTRNFAPFLYSSITSEAKAKNEDGEYILTERKGRQYVAGVTSRIRRDSYTGEYQYSYVFCANSGEFFSNETLGNHSYANYEVLSALVENVIRVDEYADAELGNTSMNTKNRGGKILTDYSIYDVETSDKDRTYLALTRPAIIALTVFICAIPLSLAVLGLVVRIKRKFL